MYWHRYCGIHTVQVLLGLLFFGTKQNRQTLEFYSTVRISNTCILQYSKLIVRTVLFATCRFYLELEITAVRTKVRMHIVLLCLQQRSLNSSAVVIFFNEKVKHNIKSVKTGFICINWVRVSLFPKFTIP